ncbi:MAG: Zn-ribbon domain-containing OB-fold protein [Hyphomicrobiaceae bacterium]
MTPPAGPESRHASPETVPLQLKLEYRHAHGWIANFLEGLRNGEAWATRCTSCGACWCPPHRNCPRDGAAMEWKRISGSGTLLQATAYSGVLPFQSETQPVTLGLIHLDGTENSMLARLGFDLGEALTGLRVRLARTPGAIAHPAQAAWFLPETETK